jgi:hypothetical protein
VQLDLGSTILALAGVLVASAFAVLAGAVSARVFFDASREQDR